MAAYSTSLKTLRDAGDVRSYVVLTNGAGTMAAHTLTRPFLVIVKRSIPDGTGAVARYQLEIQRGDVDDDGLPLSAKTAVTIEFRRPKNGQMASLIDCFGVFQDIIASDEWDAATANWLFIDENVA